MTNDGHARATLPIVINSVCVEAFPDSGVCDDDHFSHDGGEGDDWLFAVAAEAFIEGSQRRVVTCCGEAGHEQDLFDLWSPAPSFAISLCGSALSWMGCEAGKSGCLTSSDGTEL